MTEDARSYAGGELSDDLAVVVIRRSQPDGPAARRGRRHAGRSSRRGGARTGERASRRSRPQRPAAPTRSSSTCCAGRARSRARPRGAAGCAALDEALALVAALGLAVQLDVKHRGLETGRRRRAAAPRLARPELRQLVLAARPRRLRGGRAGAAACVHLSRGSARRDREPRCSRPAVRPALAALRAGASAPPAALAPRFAAQAATLNWAVVTPAAVDACHRLGVAVFVWTVNDPALARTLVESGIDGIITDDPRIVPAGSALHVKRLVTSSPRPARRRSSSRRPCSPTRRRRGDTTTSTTTTTHDDDDDGADRCIVPAGVMLAGVAIGGLAVRPPPHSGRPTPSHRR